VSAAVWSERVTVEDGRALVTPPTFLDIYTAPVFREYLAAAFAASVTRDIVIRMAAVETCDEDGLGCLVTALRRAHELDSTVYLLRVPQHVLDRLTRTGLIGQFTLIESLGELRPTTALGAAHA
jgi:anti-anti-sigma factor